MKQQQEILVFGSNLSGIHGAGAAKYARLHHGAIMGWRHYITTGEVVPFHDEAEDEPVEFTQALEGVKNSIGRFKDFLSKPIE